jgi:hypothetical protein
MTHVMKNNQSRKSGQISSSKARMLLINGAAQKGNKCENYPESQPTALLVRQLTDIMFFINPSYSPGGLADDTR